MIITGSSVLLEKKKTILKKIILELSFLKKFLDQIGNKLATH